MGARKIDSNGDRAGCSAPVMGARKIDGRAVASRAAGGFETRPYGGKFDG
jgi:hypothetical protein